MLERVVIEEIFDRTAHGEEYFRVLHDVTCVDRAWVLPNVVRKSSSDIKPKTVVDESFTAFDGAGPDLLKLIDAAVIVRRGGERQLRCHHDARRTSRIAARHPDRQQRRNPFVRK
ncbi:hypothetical protein ABH922_000274 [Rhodococcus sp. 27YEA15]|uniref:hypothetical protein n=1 Tax=Rhodococcus sp. 27YEA15 TaxID=3156259 RepID=UPI003C7E6822